MKKNYFNRILATYSLIVCMLILLFSSVFLLYIQRDTMSRIEAMNEDSFSAYVASYENAFESMQYMAQNIKYLRSLDQFAFSANNTYYQRMTALFQDLRDFSSQANNLVSTGSYSFMVHKISDDTVTTSQSTLPLSSLLDELGLNPSLYRTITGELRGGRSERYIFTDSRIIYLTQKDYVDSRVIIGVYADLQGLKLYPLDPDMQVGIQLQDEKAADLRTGLSKPLAFSAVENSLAIQQDQIGGILYKWRGSRYLNLTYYYSISGPSPASQTASLMLKLGALVALGCLLAFGIIVLFSKRLYRPIERLIDTFLSYEINTNHSKTFQNEIDYIAQNVVEIRSENQELVQRLEKSNSTLKTELINDVLQDTCNHDTIREDLKQYGISWIDGPTIPVIFELAENMMEPLAEQMRSRYTTEMVKNYSGRLCFVIRQPGPQKLKEDLKEIITFLDTAFQQSLAAYIGPLSADAGELRSSFVRANRIVENKYRMPPKSVYDYTDYERLPTEVTVYPIHNELKLIEAVEQNDEKEARRLLDYFFSEYVDRAFRSKEEHDLICFALVNTINRAIQQVGLDIQQIARPDEMVFLELKMCKTSAELKAYVTGVFDRILEAAKRTRVQKVENLQLQLKEYVEENLQNDISLLNLAEHFNLSPNYMSALFKSTMNDNFKDYISRIRFDRAVEILRQEPDIKLSTLGGRVGIYNVNTLIRMFKKFSGLSPGQYIRGLHPNGENSQ